MDILPDLSKFEINKPSYTSQRSALEKAAGLLGVDPVDLATAISYETGGSFDPWKAGPVTKWGQHRGLIQFGKPQRSRYGVYEGQSFEDQLINSVVPYLQKSGVKPGANFSQIYAAINGGSATKNLSTMDWNTGRSIADNIRNAERDHRAKVIKRFSFSDGQTSSIPDLSRWELSSLPDLSSYELEANGTPPENNRPDNFNGGISPDTTTTITPLVERPKLLPRKTFVSDAVIGNSEEEYGQLVSDGVYVKDHTTVGNQGDKPGSILKTITVDAPENVLSKGVQARKKYTARKAAEQMASDFDLTPTQIDQLTAHLLTLPQLNKTSEDVAGDQYSISKKDIAAVKGETNTQIDLDMRNAQARVGFPELSPDRLTVDKATAEELNSSVFDEARVNTILTLNSLLPNGGDYASLIGEGIAGAGTRFTDLGAGLMRLPNTVHDVALNALVPGALEAFDKNSLETGLRSKDSSVRNTYDQMQEGNTAIKQKLQQIVDTSPNPGARQFATTLIGLPLDAVRVMAIPGGSIVGMAADMGIQSHGRGESLDKNAVEAAKGVIYGSMAKFIPGMSKDVVKYAASKGPLPAAVDTLGERVTAGALTAGTTFGATYGLTKSTGSTHQQALYEAGLNTLLALPDAVIPNLPGKTARVRDSNGDTVAIKIDSNGDASPVSLPENVRSDVEILTNTKAPTRASQQLKLFVQNESKKTPSVESKADAKKVTASSLRANLAEAAREFDIAGHALADARKEFSKQTAKENYKFIAKLEAGDYSELDKGQQATAWTLRKQLDEARKRVQALGHGKLEHFYTHYFPHLWKDVGKAEKVFAGNFEGSKNFLKQRKFDTFQQGLDAGLKPIHDNPVDSILTRIREMDRYVAAHKTLDMLKADGLVKFVKGLDPVPEGFVRINDAIGHTPGGRYYAASGAAKVLNRYLSPSLNQFKTFRGYRFLGNLLTQAQLSLSAFHLGFTSMDVMTSKLALAFEQAASGRPVKALKSAAEVPISAITNPIRGHKLLKEWFKPGSTDDPAMQKIAELMVEAGGRVKMDDFYHTRAARKMVEAFKQANIYSWQGVKETGKGIAYTIPAALEQLSYPIMEIIVPRQKLGVFADLAQWELERLGPYASNEQIRESLQHVWDSVDNRMGEMVYDNLGWNRVAKDLAMASVQSVGWNLGSLREIGGAVKDTVTMPKRISNAVRGKVNTEPILSHRQAYLTSTVVLTGITGAITQYLATGTWPQELKDYFYPRVNPDGDRVQLPSYLKDIYAVSQHPVETVSHKLHPLPRLAAEMLMNKDYYGNEIRNADDPLVHQGLDLAKHVGNTVTPYSVRGAVKNVERGAGPVMTALPFIGVTPAPGSINRNKTGLLDQLTTPAEKMLQSIRSKIPDFTSKPDDQKAELLKADIRRKLQAGDKSWNDDFNKAVSAGILKRDDRKDVTSYLVDRVRPLSLEDALNVYETANEYERHQIYGLMMIKIGAYPKRFTPTQKAKLRELSLY